MHADSATCSICSTNLTPYLILPCLYNSWPMASILCSAFFIEAALVCTEPRAAVTGCGKGAADASSSCAPSPDAANSITPPQPPEKTNSSSLDDCPSTWGTARCWECAGLIQRPSLIQCPSLFSTPPLFNGPPLLSAPPYSAFLLIQHASLIQHPCLVQRPSLI